MGIDRTGRHTGPVTPDSLQQGVARENEATVLYKEFQQRSFSLGQGLITIRVMNRHIVWPKLDFDFAKMVEVARTTHPLQHGGDSFL